MANSKRKVRRWGLLLSVTAVILAGVGVFVYYRKREVPVTVQTEKVSRRNLTELVVANGKIQPVVQVVINPEVSGEIIDLPVKEGQVVSKGDLLVKIKPDNYLAGRNSAEASYKSAVAAKTLAKANFEKARIEFDRIKALFADKLVSDSQFLEAKTTLEVMKATHETSVHQADQTKATLAKSEDDLAKTTILSPMAGTVTRLRSQRGERVVGTALMAGTEIMTVAALDEMEARVDISETDVVLISLGQIARLEVDAFRDRKFSGTVTEIANASKTPGPSGSQSSSFSPSQQQEATKFEVKIRIQEKEPLRPGMSVTAEIETRYRTNVLCVPIQSVTTRLPKKPDGKQSKSASGTQSKSSASSDTSSRKSGEGKKTGETSKASEVVFLAESDRVKMVPVKRGIGDDAYVEIVEGLNEGQEVVSGGYKAINRDLEDQKKIKRGEAVESENEKKGAG